MAHNAAESAEFERGLLVAQIDMLTRDQKDMQSVLAALQSDVHDIKLTLARLEGGWSATKVVLTVVGGVVGTIVTLLVQYLIRRGSP